jgi:ESS family glutamate:Na+ symporter
MTVASFKNDLLIMALFMLAGWLIREKVKPLQKLFLPSSLIGGLLLLILGQQGFGLVTVPDSFSDLPGALISLVLASLVFGVAINKEKMRNYLDYSFITMTAYGMQMGLGVVLGFLLQKVWKGLPDGWGVMGVFAFHGGHGTAAAAASGFEKLGIADMMSVGMVLSTFGLIVAMAVGMIVVNFGIRKGWGAYVKEPKKQPEYFYGGPLPEEKRKPVGHLVTSSISINHLALQFAWLLTALLLGQSVFRLLGTFIPFFNELPSVLHGIFGGFLLWQIIRLFHLEKYVDLKTIKLITSFLLEIVVFSAMATLDLEFVQVYLVPMLIYTVILCALSIVLILFLSRKCLKHEWFEKACMAIGAATGNTSTGLALVRAIDPDSRSDAGDTHGVYSAIMSWKDIFTGLTPVWLASGITLTAGVGFGIMAVSCILAFVFAEHRKK